MQNKNFFPNYLRFHENNDRLEDTNIFTLILYRTIFINAMHGGRGKQHSLFCWKDMGKTHQTE